MKPCPKIIGLCGRAGSGKSTLAQMLVDKSSYKGTSFATPIRAMVSALLEVQGCSPEQIDGILKYNKEVPTSYLSGVSPRKAMQTLGTEWRDLISRDLWLNIWVSQIRGSNVVVDDARFRHEVKKIRALGGVIFTIHRPGLTVASAHVSETEWEDLVPDGYIRNIADPESMWTQLLAQLAERGYEAPPMIERSVTFRAPYDYPTIQS